MGSQTYITKVDLKSRGWTDKSIKYFLATSDKSIKHVSKSIPTQLYKLNRVLKIEKEKRFKELNNWQPNQTSNTFLDKETGKPSNWVNTLETHIPTIKLETLYQEACHYWHLSKELYYLERKQYDITVQLPDYKNCDKTFLHRITLKYLMHLLNNQYHKTTQRTTEIEREKKKDLQKHLYEEISKTYPFLAKECELEMMKFFPS